MKALTALLGTLLAAAIILAGPAVWWFDRRGPDAPALHLHVLFWRLDWPGLSLKARLDGLRAQEIKAGQRAQQVNARIQTISTQADQKEQAAEVQIRTVTRTITKEIAVALPPVVDRSFPLPVGLVRLHDAAARGVDLSQAPDPSGLPDDAASAVTASALAGALTDNYGECRVDQGRLKALQDWNRAVASAQAAP